MTETLHPASGSAPESAPPAPRSCRIFVVEDHPFMRRTMVEALEREAGFVVCGEADDVPAALAAITGQPPDIVLTDLALKSTSGLDLIQALHAQQPALPVVATTMFNVRAGERQARAAGATAFASKQDGPDALVTAIRTALHAAAAGDIQS